MNNEVKFSENVMLIDVAFINEVVCNAHKVLGQKLGRELPTVDLPAWLSYLALDAGLRNGDHKIDVLLLSDEGTHELKNCEPSDLEKLNGMACRTPLGEFTFTSITPARISSCEDMFIELQNMALESADVKRLMLVPFHLLYGDRVEDSLRHFFKKKSKEECNKAMYFVMEKPLHTVHCPCDPISFSLLKVFGIDPDEFN